MILLSLKTSVGQTNLVSTMSTRKKSKDVPAVEWVEISGQGYLLIPTGHTMMRGALLGSLVFKKSPPYLFYLREVHHARDVECSGKEKSLDSC